MIDLFDARVTQILCYSKTSLIYTSKNSLTPTKSITVPMITQRIKNKTPKEKRRSSKSEAVISVPSITTSGAQWYTSETDFTPNGTPVFELRQELLPKRPLRSEAEKEKRNSRPPSGQFSRPPSLTVTVRTNSSSGNSSNRDSVGTTDSSISEEDSIPPPLPAKLREVDYCNLPNNTNCENNSFLYTYRNSIRNSINKLAKSNSVDDDPPPIPPPKPPKNKLFLGKS